MNANMKIFLMQILLLKQLVLGLLQSIIIITLILMIIVISYALLIAHLVSKERQTQFGECELWGREMGHG